MISSFSSMKKPAWVAVEERAWASACSGAVGGGGVSQEVGSDGWLDESGERRGGGGAWVTASMPSLPAPAWIAWPHVPVCIHPYTRMVGDWDGYSPVLLREEGGGWTRDVKGVVGTALLVGKRKAWLPLPWQASRTVASSVVAAFILCAWLACLLDALASTWRVLFLCGWMGWDGG